MNIVIPPHTGQAPAQPKPGTLRTTVPATPIPLIDTGRRGDENSSQTPGKVPREAVNGREDPVSQGGSNDKPVELTEGLVNLKNELSDAEVRQLRELKNRDHEVKTHERAHAAAAGSLAKGGPGFQYQRGPDGRLYAVGGEVNIDVSPVPGDPRATAAKALRIQRAALAPAQPSAQDRVIAANAAAMEVRARAEIARQEVQEARQGSAAGNVSEQGAGHHSVETHTTTMQERINQAFSVASPGPASHAKRTGNILSVMI